MSICLPYFSKELKAGEVRRDLASYETCTGQQSGQPPAKIRNRWKERTRLAERTLLVWTLAGEWGATPHLCFEDWPADTCLCPGFRLYQKDTLTYTSHAHKPCT